MPKCDLLPYHVVTNSVQNNTDLGAGLPTADDDSWFYFNDPAIAPGERNLGGVWVGWTHADTRSVVWSPR